MPENTKNKQKDINIQIVYDANEKLLTDPEALFQFFFDAVQEIIANDKIVYNGFQGSKNTSQVITFNQFKYILQRLHDKIIIVNTVLTKDINNKWDFIKLDKLYNIYLKLCSYYSFNPSPFPFYSLFIGIEEGILIDALTAGKSNLYKKMWKNARDGLFSEFENSAAPLHKIVIANNVYKLEEAAPTLEAAPAAAALPDLSGFLSLPDPDKE